MNIFNQISIHTNILLCHGHDADHVIIRTLDLLYYNQLLFINQHIQVHGHIVHYLFMC